MSKEHWTQPLLNLRIWTEVIEWSKQFSSLKEAWESCDRGDYMLWLYCKLYPDNKQEFVLAKGHCANTVRHLMKDTRSTNAVDVAIAFGEGVATKEDLFNARKISRDVINNWTIKGDSQDVFSCAALAAYGTTIIFDDQVTFYASTAYSLSEDVFAKYIASKPTYDPIEAMYYARIENLLLAANLCRKYLKI